MADFLSEVVRPLLPSFFFLFSPFIFLKLEGRSASVFLRRLGLKRQPVLPLLRNSILLFAATVALLLIESFLFSQLGISDYEKVGAALKRQHVLVLIAAFTLSPLAEELFFRGYLQDKAGAFFSAAAFGFLHYVYGSVAETVFAFSVALLFGWFVRSRRQLVPVIVAHALFNAFSLYLLFNYP